MLKTMKEFMIKMFQVPVGWRIWLAILMVANMGAPLFFLNRIEAWAVFIAINLGAFTGAYLYKKQGFTRLLGLMHWPWLFLLPFLWGRLDVVSAGEPFGIWIRVVLVLNSLSLILDAVDVIKYAAGDREPVIYSATQNK